MLFEFHGECFAFLLHLFLRTGSNHVGSSSTPAMCDTNNCVCCLLGRYQRFRTHQSPYIPEALTCEIQAHHMKYHMKRRAGNNYGAEARTCIQIPTCHRIRKIQTGTTWPRPAPRLPMPRHNASELLEAMNILTPGEYRHVLHGLGSCVVPLRCYCGQHAEYHQ